MSLPGTDSENNPLAFPALLLGGIAIGFAGIFVRWSDVNPVASAFWRMALAAPLLWIWAIATRRRDAEQGKSLDFSMILLWCGVWFASDIGVYHLAFAYTSVANATLLANFAPVFIACWVWLVHKVRFSPLFLAGNATALAGVIMLIGPHAALGGSRLLGDMLGLLTAVFYAGYQLATKSARRHYSTLRLMAWATTLTALLLLPFALLMDGAFWPQHASGWLPLLALGLVAQIGGQTTIAYAFAHLPSSLASISLLIQPLTAAIAAWALLGESISGLQVCGAVLLLGGIYLAKRGS